MKVLRGVLSAGLAVFVAFAMIVGAIGFAIQYAVESVQRAASCAVGGAILAPLNITVEGVKLVDGFVDGAIGLGGDILGGIGGVFGIGNDDDGLSLEQLENASIIVGVGLSRGETPRNIQIALMGPFAESGMRNVTHGDRDSLGLYQMRPSQGWGTQEEVLDPVYAANKFFEVMHSMFTQEQIDSRPLWETAADVLRPAEEYRMRYDEHKETAASLVAGLVPEAIGSVALVGDSLSVGMQSSAAFYLQQSGYATAIIDAASGRRILADGQGTPRSGRRVVLELLENDHEPRLWIIDLGTNDVASGTTTLEDSEALIEQLLEAVPDDAEVAWVNLHMPGEPAAATFNEALNGVADDDGDVRVVDWDRFATSSPSGLLAEDGVHYTASGYDQRAAFVTRVAADSSSGNSIFGFNIPSSCDFGGQVIGGVLDILTGEVGLPFGGKGDANNQELFEWAFAETGYDLDELLANGRRLNSLNLAQLGDLVLLAENSSNPEEITRTGIYMGNGKVLLEPRPGEVTAITTLDWADVDSVIRVQDGLLIGGEEAAEQPPIPRSETVEAAGFYVHPAIANQVEGLIAAAEAADINLGGGGWRSSEEQITLRRAHCGTSQYAIYEMPSTDCTPPTARPGSSMHERGLAIDFTCDGALIVSQGNKCFRWLADNAETFGLFNFELEPWHWSVNGK